MKKIIPILFLALAIVTGCTSAKDKSATPEASLQKENENITFEYTALTRGAYKKIIVTSYEMITSKDHTNKEVVVRKITPEEWKLIYTAYKEVKDITTIDALKAPSQKHQFDGALAAMLTVKLGEQVYQTTSFDHGNPPAEIKNLVNVIVKLSGTN